MVVTVLSDVLRNVLALIAYGVNPTKYKLTLMANDKKTLENTIFLLHTRKNDEPKYFSAVFSTLCSKSD